MRHILNIFGRWALGVAFATYIGIYSIAGQQPRRSWLDDVLIAVMAAGLVLLVATSEAITAHRPTFHVGVRSGLRGLWIEPAAKPIRSAERVAAKREVKLGRRAIEVGAKVLKAYGDARRVVDPLAANPWGDPANYANYQTTYTQELNTLKSKVGGAWEEVL